jgi:hypothetical protein
MDFRENRPMWSRLPELGIGLTVALLAFTALARGQAPAGFAPADPYAGHKKVLIIGDVHTAAQMAHDAISHALATLEHLGRESGAYIAFIRTDTQLVTKEEVYGTRDYAKGGPKQARGRNLDYFDAVVFYTNGSPLMTDQQKHDLLAFVHDDGKGFVAVHTATGFRGTDQSAGRPGLCYAPDVAGSVYLGTGSDGA